MLTSWLVNFDSPPAMSIEENLRKATSNGDWVLQKYSRGRGWKCFICQDFTWKLSICYCDGQFKFYCCNPYLCLQNKDWIATTKQWSNATLFTTITITLLPTPHITTSSKHQISTFKSQILNVRILAGVLKLISYNPV